LLASATMLNGQVSPSLSVDDLKALRQALADREFFKQRAENAEAMVTALTASRDGWKALYEAEKLRADQVQGGRIAELTAANTQLHIQANADKQRIGELTFDNIKLKSARKWYFLTGLGTGAVAGAYAAKKFSF